MCPDPVLLVAYLDRTLFYRDATAVEQHLSNCERCAALLAAMRQERAAASSAGRSHRWMIPAAITVLALGGLGAWAFLPRSKDAPPSVETPVPREIAPPPAETSAPTTSVPAEPPRPVARATPTPTPKPPSIERDVKPRVQWRTRDILVERSTDGGETWTTEYTADRSIRAGAFVNADIAWIVGENGLILRRTKNGWFGATSPAEGHITAVRASSPSKATVTLEDGRVFTTENGGVTWSAP